MIEYDPNVIQEYAKGLYEQSRSVVTCYFFIGIFLGMLVFWKVSEILVADFDFLIIAIGVLIGGVIGYGTGKSRAFEMKLAAQQALCQVEIAKNTKK